MRRYSLLLLLLISGCDKNITSLSSTTVKIKYIPNPKLAGEEAIRNAGHYWINFSLGEMEIPLKAIIDTQSSILIINNDNIWPNNYIAIGKEEFLLDYRGQKTKAVRSRESINLKSAPNMRTSFAHITNKTNIPNVFGLGYPNPLKRPQEENITPFLDQLAYEYGYQNVFSLKLCGIKSTSSILIGGIDKNMQDSLGNFLNIIDDSSLSIPLISIRRADNKKVLATFNRFQKDGKSFSKAQIDSATVFTMLPSRILDVITAEIIDFAKNSGINFPIGFFRTERGSTIKTVRFPNLKKIRQYPSFELGFLGADGQEKYLILSPLRYFKEMDPIDTLVRTFAFRASPKEIILGQPFIENYYMFINREIGLIGFGDINKACELKIK